MGKIKSKAIKRTAKIFTAKGVAYEESFEKNKKLLGNTMPSKKIKNQLAGFLSRIKKQERIKQEKLALRK
jgi:ribosomal protein S17E